jgi:putative ABC transport system permease protein
MDLDVVQGSLAAVTAGGVGVSESSGQRVGARVRVGGAELVVRAVYRRTISFGDYLMGPADLARVGGHPYPVTAFVRAAPGVAPADARLAVEAAVSGFSGVEVHSRSELRERNLAELRSARAVYRTLSILATLIGLFGVASTLAVSIVERRRELGMLRAVGMQRRQVRAMIRVEGVIVALVGAALGLAVGVAFGWAATRVLANSSMPTAFTLPVGTLAVCVPLVAVAGLLSSAVPARLAGRVDVLRAVTTE